MATAGLLDAVMAEVARLEAETIHCLQSKRMAVDLQDQVQDDADKKVYSYGASARAASTRREENGGIKDRNHIYIVQNGLDITIEAKAPLQHAYSYWKGINASNVVIDGRKNYKQPYPRNFLLENELATAAEVSLISFLKHKGFDITGGD